MRVIALIVVASFALAGCGERDQEPVAGENKRSYQGKRDTLPWDNEPLAAEFRGGKWSKGDRVSWETQIKTRQFGQHEDKRIYQ